jgi:hypothetical protein
MLIGATMNTDDLDAYAPMLVGNNIMRIFPNAITLPGGTDARVLPRWNDTRFKYCLENGTVPFVSTKVDGNPAGIAYVKAQLLEMPTWITTLYITDRHEPEADVSADAYQRNFRAFLAMVDSLPPALRSRIKCGPVLTKTWTERAGAGRSYSTYDPGVGDFFGVDMYVESGTAKAVVSPATLPNSEQFTAQFKAYRKNADDHRDRLWPEWGVVGMPDDNDGTTRAAWIRAVHDLVAAWDPAQTGWKFTAMIWWNAAGKATGEVAEIGQRRDFPLHLRTQPATARTAGATATAVVLPGDPPAPVAAYNEIFLRANKPAVVDNSPPPPVAVPPVMVPPAGDPADPSTGTYQDGWKAGRQQLLAQITALVQGTGQ